MTTLWDPIRSLYVKATPEEKVRQKWISIMLGPLGYPKGLLSVEKDLASFVRDPKSLDPNRRIDILCYTPYKEGLRPLLLIECKAKEKFAKAEQQILGYNEVIQAPFLCVIQGEVTKTFWFQNGALHSVPFLPPYQQLVSFLC